MVVHTMDIATTSHRKTSFQITPPLLNSSNPWATSATDLKARKYPTAKYMFLIQHLNSADVDNPRATLNPA